MNFDNLVQAINFETILKIYNRDYDKVCEIWDKYRHLFLFEISSDFSLWASKLDVSINELYSTYNLVKDNFKTLDKNVKILIYGDAYWPNQINDFPYPTRVLYCLGDVSLLKKQNIAIIGSKSPKQENIVKLDKLVATLIKSEIIITSGLELGTQGHASAKSLSNFAPIIGVIATSFDSYHPKEHRIIQDYIAKEGGLLVTRVAPNDNNLKWNILLRNRLMSALSNGIFILEDVDGGGSITLADYSLKNNRKVYFFSSQKKDETILWPNLLIEKGAKSIRYPGDFPKAINNKVNKKRKKKKVSSDSEQLSLFS